jgi:hypothetical protein
MFPQGKDEDSATLAAIRVIYDQLGLIAGAILLSGCEVRTSDS